MNEAILLLWDKISNLIDEKIGSQKYDSTFKSTVWKVNTDNTYSINYKGQLYNVRRAIDTDLKVGQSVWVKIPTGWKIHRSSSDKRSLSGFCEYKE